MQDKYNFVRKHLSYALTRKSKHINALHYAMTVPNHCYSS